VTCPPSTTGETRSDVQRIMEVRGLRKAFGGQVVLDGIDLSLCRGDVVLLRGPNGSGKTTLLNILTGNIKPDAGSIWLNANGHPRTFTFPRPWWKDLGDLGSLKPETMARSGIGRSWQEMRLFSTLSLRDNIVAAMPHELAETPLHALFRRGRARKEEEQLLSAAQASLVTLGLGERTSSSADMISLGQAKRVAIARTVLGGARVLFLDEPLAGLDSEGTRDVLTMLQRLAQERQITLVITEHVFNMPLVLDFATVVWTLDEGHVVVQSPAEAENELDASFGDGVVALLRQTMGPDAVVKTLSLGCGATLTTMGPASSGGDASSGGALLEVRDLVVKRNQRVVIGGSNGKGEPGLSLTLRRGEVAVLEAPNGWGKTTLLDALGGLAPIAGGTISLLGTDITRRPAWERRKLGLSVLQARDHIFPALTVREMLKLSGVPEVPDQLSHLANQCASALSGGEKQKTALACFLGSPPVQVALLDEPFSALDAEALMKTWERIRHLLPECAVLVAVPGACSIREENPTGRVGDAQ